MTTLEIMGSRGGVGVSGLGDQANHHCKTFSTHHKTCSIHPREFTGQVWITILLGVRTA